MIVSAPVPFGKGRLRLHGTRGEYRLSKENAEVGGKPESGSGRAPGQSSKCGSHESAKLRQH